jgi:hypothetical protein
MTQTNDPVVSIDKSLSGNSTSNKIKTYNQEEIEQKDMM